MSTALPQEKIDAIAAEWIARCDAGLTPGEAAELAAWRAAHASHAEALARYEALWSAVGRPRRQGAADQLAQRVGDLRRRRRSRRWSATAAALTLGFASWFAWTTLPPAREPASRIATAVLLLPQHQELPDGSRVEYPRDAEFTVDFTGGVRRVRLTRGEAHFAVAKNQDWPFVVEAGGVEFRAVGTAFAVQLRAESAQLVVTEGQVSVERSGAPVLKPGITELEPMGIVEAGNRVVVALTSATLHATEVATVSTAEMTERLAWRNPRAEFSGTPLREIVELLNRQNRQQITLADAQLGDVQVSGVFRTDEIDPLLHALELGFGLRVERGDGVVRLHPGR